MKFSLPNEYPLVAIYWDDPSGSATDVINRGNVDLKHKSVPIITVGWLLKDDDLGVSVCGEYCSEGDYRSHTVVLRSLIRKMVIIRKAKQERPPPPPA